VFGLSLSIAEILKEASKGAWEDCYRHPFVQELGAGTLDREAFRFYLVQDYVYLIEYARVFAAGALKASGERLMTHFAAMQHAILHMEMDLHRAYMASYGISPEEAGNAAPSLFNKAYTSNMLAVAQTGGAAEILAVVLPCAWSYYDYGTRLRADYADRLEGNPYRSWIEMYAGDEYRESIQWLFDALEDACEGASESGRNSLSEIFETSVRFEYLFWDMAYTRRMSYEKRA
jgi:Putative transcription activator